MNQNEIDYIRQLTGLTDLQRRAMARHYGRLPEELRLEAHRLQTEIMRQRRLQCRREQQHIFACAMLLVAVSRLHSLESGRHGKGAISLEEAGRISAIRIARANATEQRKASPVKYLIEVRLFEEIRRLREVENMSWRQVAAYVGRYHKRRISHTYLQRVWEDIAENRKPPA